MNNYFPERLTSLGNMLLEGCSDEKRHDFGSSHEVENVYDFYYGREHFKITFFPRNATPLLQYSDNPARIFMPSQPWTRLQQWENFAASMRSNARIIQEDDPNLSPADLDSRTLLYICAYPISLLQAAVVLRPEGIHLQNLLEAFQKPFKPTAYGEFSDLVIAGKFVDQEGKSKTTPDFEGEALVLNSLLGSQESTIDLMNRKAALARMSQVEQDKSNPGTIDTGTESDLQLKDFVMVHATNYLPYVDSGRVFLRTSFDHSGEELARTSIHFSLNHHVISHKQGHWENQPYVLIAPAEEVVTLNGNPYSFRPEDTYYLLYPGTPIVLPQSTILMRPKPDEEPDLSPIPCRTIRYGFSTFTSSDLEAIAARWDTFFESESRVEQARRWDLRVEPFGFSNRNQLPSWVANTSPTLYGSLREFIQARLRHSQRSPQRPESNVRSAREFLLGSTRALLGRLRKRSKEQARDALDDVIWAEVPTTISRDNLVGDYPSVREDLQRMLGFINKMTAADKIIQELGFELRYVDPDYLFDEDYAKDEVQRAPDIEEVLTFTKKAGFSTIRHPKTPEGDLDQHLFHMKRALRPENDNEHMNPYEKRQYLKALQDIARKKFLASSPQIRSMIYLTGVYQIGDYYF